MPKYGAKSNSTQNHICKARRNRKVSLLLPLKLAMLHGISSLFFVLLVICSRATQIAWVCIGAYDINRNKSFFTAIFLLSSRRQNWEKESREKDAANIVGFWIRNPDVTTEPLPSSPAMARAEPRMDTRLCITPLSLPWTLLLLFRYFINDVQITSPQIPTNRLPKKIYIYHCVARISGRKRSREVKTCMATSDITRKAGLKMLPSPK